MFFILSKIFNFFLDPLNLLIISFFLFLFISARAKKNRFKGIVWFLPFWILLLYKPIPEFLVKRLEDRFVYKEEVFLGLDGIIVLGGGATSGKVAKDRNEYSLGEGSERIIKGLEFLSKNPQGTVIFTGFSPALIHEGHSEAEIIEKLIEALNVDSTNIVFEKRSRNTFENASYTNEIINELQIKKWGVVTSASHMKRAIEAFNHQNSEISFDPIPVDFQTNNSIYWGPGKMQSSLKFWRIYIHETIGYWVYKLTGRL